MEKIVALTFDDGPNTTTTVQVLDVLKKYGIKATFFLIGDRITQESAESVKRAIAMGCEIENHSWTHSFMTKLEPQVIKDEIKRTSDKIEEITGRRPEFFRPPYIEVSRMMVDNIDLPFICGVNGLDWEPEVMAKERAELVLENVGDGEVILLHDMEGNDETVKALDIIIPELMKNNFEFVTVSELFKRKGIEPKIHSGIVYTDVLQTEEFEYQD